MTDQPINNQDSVSIPFLNKEFLSAGLAWHYKKYSRDPELAKLQFEARSAKRGLWAEPDPVPPWEWRRKKRQ